MRHWRSGMMLFGLGAVLAALASINPTATRAAVDQDASPSPGRFRVLPPGGKAVRKLPVREAVLTQAVRINRTEADAFLRRGFARAGLLGLAGFLGLAWIGYRLSGSTQGRRSTSAMRAAAGSPASGGAVTAFGNPRSRG